MNISITMDLDEREIENLSSEYDENDNSFTHEFFRKVLLLVAKKTAEMSQTVNTVEMLNPLGNFSPCRKEEI